MTNEISLMDVTLRDGGYRNNFDFNSEHLRTILLHLNNANVEYIEIGYRNGSIRPIPSIGDAGMCQKPYLELCRSIVQNAGIAVMVHPKNVTSADLKELKECGTDLVRICVVPNGYEKAAPVIIQCLQLGMKVSVNLTRLSRYSEQQLDENINLLLQHPIDMIYLADSNGSMMSSQVQKIYEKYTSLYDVDFGFHAHDNLGLAQANSIAAMNAGAKLIDVSLSGMGKGIGNLKAEFFIAYLHALDIKKYHLNEIRMGANYIQNTVEQRANSIELNDFMMGISDLSIDDIKQLSEII